MGWLQDKLSKAFNPIDPRNNPYTEIDQGNFDLPGFNDRGRFARTQMEGAQGRVAGGDWREQQKAAMGRYQGMYNDDAQSLALGQAQRDQASAAAQQRSLMASASPSNAAMMARVGSQNIGRAGQAIAGNAMMGRIAERQGLADTMSNLALSGRGQDLQQAGQNDAYTQGMYGGGMQNAALQQQGGMNYEAQRSQRFAAAAGQPTTGQRLIGALTGGIAAAGGGDAPSDRRLKTDIRPGAGDANAFMDSVNPQSYNYKPEAGMPSGRFTGVMAQDLEKTQAGAQAVTDTPGGKMVDFGKLGGTIVAGLAALNDRLKNIEAGKRPEELSRERPKQAERPERPEELSRERPKRSMYLPAPRMMEEGGVVTKPTNAIVGEAGPEAVIPLDKLPDVVRLLGQYAGSNMSMEQIKRDSEERRRYADFAADAKRRAAAARSPFQVTVGDPEVSVGGIEHERDYDAEFPFAKQAEAENLRREARTLAPAYDWLKR